MPLAQVVGNALRARTRTVVVGQHFSPPRIGPNAVSGALRGLVASLRQVRRHLRGSQTLKQARAFRSQPVADLGPMPPEPALQTTQCRLLTSLLRVTEKG